MGDSEAGSSKLTLRFGDRSIRLGFRFWTAIACLVIVVVLYVLIPATSWAAWIPFVANTVVGVALGLVLQPTTIKASNATHAEFATTSLVDTARSVAGSRYAVDQLARESDSARIPEGLMLINAELARTFDRLMDSINEWDKIEPGVTKRVAELIEKRNSLPKQFGIEEK